MGDLHGRSRVPLARPGRERWLMWRRLLVLQEVLRHVTRFQNEHKRDNWLVHSRGMLSLDGRQLTSAEVVSSLDTTGGLRGGPSPDTSDVLDFDSKIHSEQVLDTVEHPMLDNTGTLTPRKRYNCKKPELHNFGIGVMKELDDARRGGLVVTPDMAPGTGAASSSVITPGQQTSNTPRTSTSVPPAARNRSTTEEGTVRNIHPPPTVVGTITEQMKTYEVREDEHEEEDDEHEDTADSFDDDLLLGDGNGGLEDEMARQTCFGVDYDDPRRDRLPGSAAGGQEQLGMRNTASRRRDTRESSSSGRTRDSPALQMGTRRPQSASSGAVAQSIAAAGGQALSSRSSAEIMSAASSRSSTSQGRGSGARGAQDETRDARMRGALGLENDLQEQPEIERNSTIESSSASGGSVPASSSGASSFIYPVSAPGAPLFRSSTAGGALSGSAAGSLLGSHSTSSAAGSSNYIGGGSVPTGTSASSVVSGTHITARSSGAALRATPSKKLGEARNRHRLAMRKRNSEENLPPIDYMCNSVIPDYGTKGFPMNGWVSPLDLAVDFFNAVTKPHHNAGGWAVWNLTGGAAFSTLSSITPGRFDSSFYTRTRTGGGAVSGDVSTLPPSPIAPGTGATSSPTPLPPSPIAPGTGATSAPTPLPPSPIIAPGTGATSAPTPPGLQAMSSVRTTSAAPSSSTGGAATSPLPATTAASSSSTGGAATPRPRGGAIPAPQSKQEERILRNEYARRLDHAMLLYEELGGGGFRYDKMFARPQDLQLESAAAKMTAAGPPARPAPRLSGITSRTPPTSTMPLRGLPPSEDQGAEPEANKDSSTPRTTLTELQIMRQNLQARLVLSEKKLNKQEQQLEGKKRRMMSNRQDSSPLPRSSSSSASSSSTSNTDIDDPFQLDLPEAFAVRMLIDAGCVHLTAKREASLPQLFRTLLHRNRVLRGLELLDFLIQKIESLKALMNSDFATTPQTLVPRLRDSTVMLINSDPGGPRADDADHVIVADEEQDGGGQHVDQEELQDEERDPAPELGGTTRPETPLQHASGGPLAPSPSLESLPPGALIARHLRNNQPLIMSSIPAPPGVEPGASLEPRTLADADASFLLSGGEEDHVGTPNSSPQRGDGAEGAHIHISDGTTEWLRQQNLPEEDTLGSSQDLAPFFPADGTQPLADIEEQAEGGVEVTYPLPPYQQ
ncbi:unnamed protein product [Amoebophrya sp. A25]|nr:unnamed protein product [Amoebophrya sp. A25]|eukprot:GSA25T00008604001.1